jgi:hypothetical protein
VGLLLPLVVLGLAGCNPENPYSFDGQKMSEFFPFDGDVRTWQFVNESEDVSNKINAEVLYEEATGKPGQRVYPVVYFSECPSNDPGCTDGEEFFRIHWRSSDSEGVFIHGYSVAGGELVEFKPPLQVADSDGKVGDLVETKTGGANWTSEFTAIESCPVQMLVDWESCSRFRIETDGADGYPLQGDWWAIVQYNVVAFQLDGDVGMWQLKQSKCDPPESCDGQW